MTVSHPMIYFRRLVKPFSFSVENKAETFIHRLKSFLNETIGSCSFKFKFNLFTCDANQLHLIKSKMH